MVFLSAVIHPCSSNRARCRATLLIEANALTLHYAATSRDPGCWTITVCTQILANRRGMKQRTLTYFATWLTMLQR